MFGSSCGSTLLWGPLFGTLWDLFWLWADAGSERKYDIQGCHLAAGLVASQRQYCRFLSIGNSIDGQSPETTAETNLVWWQIELGLLQCGFVGLIETSCAQTPGFGFANPVSLASNCSVRRPSFEGLRSWKPRLFKGMTLPVDRSL